MECKYQIFKQVDGKLPKPYKYIYNDLESAQKDLRQFMTNFFSVKDNMMYLRKSEPGYNYTEPGWYYAGNGDLLYADSVTESSNFLRYSYDNWKEFIEDAQE